MATRSVRYEISKLFDGSYALYVEGERKRWWSRHWQRFRKLVHIQDGPMALSKTPVISLDWSWVDMVKTEAESRRAAATGGPRG